MTSPVVNSSATRFSVVIPAYNEESCLPRLLDSVDRARAAYAGGPAAIEVIVADNASTDATPRLARCRGCLVVHVPERVIASARNAGAAAASGEILAFVDADSLVHPDTFDEIDRLLATGRVVGGTTGATFGRRSAGLACTYAALVVFGLLFRGLRVLREGGIDTGVVFCPRTDFEAIGGYRERHRWGEDVWLLLDLKRRGWRSGRRLAGGTAAKATCSTRKFDQHGDWHYFTLPLRIAWEALRGREDSARRYWYDPR